MEHGAAAALDAKLGRCSSGQGRCGGVDWLDVDLAGLRIGGLWLERDGLRLHARDVTVGPDRNGIAATIDGLQATVSRGKTAAVGKRESRPGKPGAAHSASPRRGLLSRLEGIPLTVETRGEVSMQLADETVVVVQDARIRVDKNGAVDADFVAKASHPKLAIASHDRLRARAKDISAGPWLVEGTVGLEGGAPAKLRAAIHRNGMRMSIVSPDGGGAAELALPREWNDKATITLDAKAFSLAALQPLEKYLPFRTNLQHASLDGRVRLRRHVDGVSAEVEGVTVHGLTIDSPHVARGAVRFRDLALEGDTRLETGRVHADLEVSHGGASMHVTGSIGRDRIDLHARLAPVACQDLLESMPDGITSALDGMALTGDIEGSLRLQVAMADVREAQAREQQTGREQSAPGELDLDFPFVERCRVTRDAPGVDLAALRGPYRHRFVSDSGKEQERLLDRRAPGFVPLAAVPNLAIAFVTLEDARFWSHRGFDTEQIERALWHNLAAGRVERGASTITQQTARNLWLGVDRSLSRKVQEAVLAARLEQGLSKQRILELYLNVIELGPEIHGVADAARFHFGKAAHELDLLEAVHLAALAPGPRLYSRRFASGEVNEEWMAELRHQIRRMYLHGRISREAMRTALRSRLVLVDHTVEEST
jgi:hypothetical protein